MKKITGVCAALLLSAPFSAAALDLDFGSQFPFGNIDSFVSGIMSSVNIATSSSGGNVAPGGPVVTGDSSASARVQTIINNSSGSTTFTTKIRTESDGVVRIESMEKKIAPNTRVHIDIATSSPDASVKVQAVVEAESDQARAGFLSSFWKHVRAFFGFF